MILKNKKLYLVSMLIIVLYCYDIFTRLNKWSYKIKQIFKIKYDKKNLWSVSCKLYFNYNF